MYDETYVHVKTVPVKVHSTLTLLLQLALLLDRQGATTRSERVVLILLWLWLLLRGENVKQTTHEELLVQRREGLDGVFWQEVEDIGITFGLLGILGNRHVDFGQRTKFLEQFPEIVLCAGIWQVSDKEASSIGNQVFGSLLLLFS
jgi:hypothetical protein